MKSKIIVLKKAEAKSRLAVVSCRVKGWEKYFNIAKQIFDQKTKKWRTISITYNVMYESPEQAVYCASTYVDDKKVLLTDVVQIIE